MDQPLGLLKRIIAPLRPRMKPSLIIVGAQKAGTSAMFKMLGKHSKVALPKVKELDHFSNDDAYAEGMDAYLSNFPVKPINVSGCVTFEASPSYLFYSAKSAERIATHLPEAYCLALLRDPVKRAYSAWNMYRDFVNQNKYADTNKYLHLHDPRPFHQAVEDELQGRTGPMWHRYLLRGKYAQQVQDFKDNITPERLLVRSFLDLKRDPQKFIMEIFELLGLPKPELGLEAFSTRSNVRPYEQRIDPELEKRLYAYFEPEMEKLQQVLGYDLNIMENNG